GHCRPHGDRVLRRPAHDQRRRDLRLPAPPPALARKERTMMTHRCHSLSRRDFLAAAAAGLSLGPWGSAARGEDRTRPEEENKALVAITLDLEMSRNFPTWETTHWDYEKGNLNDETKKYAALACKRVKARGGVLHCFLVGRVLEQESVAWLRDILEAGHP